ncbi:MAG: alpha/beta fold hydrolase [Flavobacteriales bacterium]
MKIYALGGLGADKRTFTYFNLKNHELVCLDWIVPLTDETLEQYAVRYNQLIPSGQHLALLGVSFGGMIMTEVAKLRNPEHTILISSVTTASELRWVYRAAGKLNLDKLVPYSFLVKSGRVAHYLFGVKLMKDKELLKSILDDMDPRFLRWAIRVILSWDNEKPIHALRIHGTSDRVLPISKDKITHPFKKGGHFIIVNEAESISKIIDDLKG